MFQTKRRRTYIEGLISMFELIFHATVRKVRQTHRHPVLAILVNMLQTILLVLAFSLMFYIIGARNMGIRGDFLVYIMTGIFLYMTHIKSMGAVQGAEGPTSPMMQHAPMNTAVSIGAALLSSIYIQIISAVTVLYVYHALVKPVEIHDPAGAMGMLILAWYTGSAVGLVMLGLKPWAPTFVAVFSQVYMRANMIASGKMFVANSLPASLLMMFDWNPLFHIIDQSRGFAFVNYFPRNTNWEYPLIVGTVLICIGMMLEFYTRQRASASWEARQ